TGVVNSGWEGQVGPAGIPSQEDFGIEVDIEIPFSGLDPETPVAALPSPSRRAEAMVPVPSGSAGIAAAPGQRKKVLVVDDEDDIRLLISRVLTEKGYAVVTAGRGLEAIQKVQTENPDMIILDAMLPEVHGFDICKKIKGSRKYGHIPVIMISAIYRGWRYAQDLKDSYGVDDFIEKPFKIGEFLKKVESHFAALESGPGPAPEPDLSGEAERILARSVEVYHAPHNDKAMELLRGGLEIDPLSFKLHYNLGLLLGKKALNYQAIREIEYALELAPDFFPAVKNLALLYQKTGFKFKAIETWERALQHCPDDETRDGIKRHLMSLL
ncbi:MAG TPA: response regulator, partial [Polyangia bacterium]|nr:response regulator [Polyangia bacterium]